MTLYIQDYDTEDVIFSTNYFNVVPSNGESIRVNDEWYTVVERVFSFKELENVYDNSCTIFVNKI